MIYSIEDYNNEKCNFPDLLEAQRVLIVRKDLSSIKEDGQKSCLVTEQEYNTIVNCKLSIFKKIIDIKNIKKIYSKYDECLMYNVTFN